MILIKLLKFYWVKINIYHQIGNAYLACEFKIEKDVAVAGDRVLVDAIAIRLVNNAFAYCFNEASLIATGGSHIEHNKHCGQVSTIMRALTSKDGDLLSHLDKSDESEAEFENTSLHNHLRNHNVAANKGKLRVQIPLEHIFGFCKTFKISNQLGIHLTFETADLQDIIYTTLGDNIEVIFGKFFFYVPIIVTDAQTQIMFIDSIEKRFTLSFDFWSTDRKIVETHLEYQIDIGSAQNISSPKYLIVTHQTAARIGVPNIANSVAVFGILDVRKNHVDIDGVRYPIDVVSTDYASNDYLDQNRDLKIFYEEYVAEELLNPYISYTDMKNENHIQIIDLKFPVDLINP